MSIPEFEFSSCHCSENGGTSTSYYDVAVYEDSSEIPGSAACCYFPFIYSALLMGLGSGISWATKALRFLCEEDPDDYLQDVGRLFPEEGDNTVQEMPPRGASFVEHFIRSFAQSVHQTFGNMFDEFNGGRERELILDVSNTFRERYLDPFVDESKDWYANVTSECQELAYGEELLQRYHPNDPLKRWMKKLFKKWPKGEFEIYCDGLPRLFPQDFETSTEDSAEECNLLSYVTHNPAQQNPVEVPLPVVVKERIEFFEQLTSPESNEITEERVESGITVSLIHESRIPEEEREQKVNELCDEVGVSMKYSPEEEIDENGFCIISDKYTSLEWN